ncbi:hypothetical protein C8Q76DRAFT_609013 [Earliella scabrosa]|nr:hypothetical protein C8Q76DRAFT_609013 [Earliella scabrosa]
MNKAWLEDTGFIIVKTANKVDATDPSKQRVDCAMYRTDHAPSLSEENANWAAVDVPIELKPDDAKDDPFDDDAKDFEPTSGHRKENLGQILSYCALVCAKQHRTHLFTAIIFGNMARLVRWDRAGVVVTRKFNYVENPHMLGRFFWRIARLCDTQRGYDPTATFLVTESEEYRAMTRRADEPRKIGKHAYQEHARRLFKALLANLAERWKLKVGDGPTARYFLTGNPHFIASGLAGRGTRGYVALDCDDLDGPFVFLKDCWRVVAERIKPEGETLEVLNDPATGKIEGIPTLVCHGDVEDQVTISQDVWQEQNPGEKCRLKTHRHYRIVVKEVGLPMSYFRNGKELVYLLAGCINAHLGAYKKGIIHRDISTGNVLIFIEEFVDEHGKFKTVRNGMLTDWELSKHVDDDDGPRQPDRTGTWQFLSALILDNLGKDVEITDEMESFLHLLIWFAVRFLPHNCHDVGQFVMRYFDDYMKDNGEYCCGVAKKAAMNVGSIWLSHGELTFLLPKTLNLPAPAGSSRSDYKLIHPINGLVKDFLELLHSHYMLHAQTTINAATTIPRHWRGSG